MKQNRLVLVLLFWAVAVLTGCGAQAAAQTVDQETTESTAESDTAVVTETANLFSDRDLDGSYAESDAIQVTLEGDTISCDSDAVVLENGRILLSEEGVYVFSGNWTDGQIVVDAADTAKVQIVLQGAEIASSTSAAIYAREADKVFVTLAEGTENTLSNGGSYETIDENNIDAVIFAKTDLTLNGTGSLTIQAAAGHGVVSKDDLVITQGSYMVTAAGHGLSAKDSLAVNGGVFVISSGKDGIHVENADDAALGALYITDGTFTIDAEGDAISASGALEIHGGDYTLTTGEGSASVTIESSDADMPGQRGGMPMEQTDTTQQEEETTSQKGIKAEGTFSIYGGTFNVDTVDDGLHAGGDMLLSDGTFAISSGDDAVHGDGAVTIQGGEYEIANCYEGIEGLSLTIDDGVFDITSHDDGLNAAGGADGSGFGGFGKGPQDTFTDTSDSFIVINGGDFTVVSGGDCIDSNGDLTINDGTLDLTCNGNGDTALDTDGTYTHNGGTVTTNDGSENNAGGMGQPGGGRPGGGTRPTGPREESDAEQGSL